MNDNMIKMWRFEDAPEKLQRLSRSKGNEEFVFLVPEHMAQEFSEDPMLECILQPSYVKPDRIGIGAYVCFITSH